MQYFNFEKKLQKITIQMTNFLVYVTVKAYLQNHLIQANSMLQLFNIIRPFLPDSVTKSNREKTFYGRFHN